MVILSRLLGWIITPIGTYVVGAVVLLAAWQGNNYFQRQQGARDALVKVEQTDKRNVTKANAAAVKSRVGSGGVLDPYRRAD